jgi:translocation and assembly module TamB
MWRGLRWLLGFLLFLLVIAIAVPLGLVVALNSKTGRDFAVKEINHFTGGNVVVSGLGGHFPADLKLAGLTVADAKGVWLTASELELRWSPREMLFRKLHVTSLTAAKIAVVRAPVSRQPAKKSSSPLNLYHFTGAIDRVAIGQLGIGADLAGRPIELAATGNAKVETLTQGDVNLTATAANAQGTYQVAAAIDDQNINMKVHISEPPDGLLGHYAGPQVHDPLRLDLSLAGPRNDAALNFAAALGAAAMDGSGTLDLDPDAPHADVVLSIPSLAPIGKLAKQTLGGTTKLHLVAAQNGKVTHISLAGDVALTAAPGPAAKLVGKNGHLSLRVSLANHAADIQSLTVTGAEFNAAAAGQIAQSGVNLKTHLDVDQVADLSPGISGNVVDDNVITGTLKDFAVHAVVSGTIKQKEIPSGPFTLALDAQHLPQTPNGTLKGSGELENAPLTLDTAFARDAGGNIVVHVASATWRSIDAKADLALAAGAQLPTGTAEISIKRLADLAAFSPVPISGSVHGDFAHQDAQNFGLNLTASALDVSPALGPIDAKVSASGPLARLAIKLNATLAKLAGAPLQIATSGTVNADTQSVGLATLTAAWKSLDVKLLGPASVDTKPDIIVHHLALGVNGGTLRLDGRLTPGLDLNLAVSDLPASLAQIASPGIDVSGTLAANAQISGSSKAPAGKVTLNAHQIQLHSGPAEALPPADLIANVNLARRSATLDARLDAGPDAHLEVSGLAPLTQTGPLNLKLAGMLNLMILDPIMAAQGTTIRGVITPDFTVTGTPKAPDPNGTLALSGGSVQNIGSGLNLLDISAHVQSANRRLTLQDFSTAAGAGHITGHGTIDLGASEMPVDFEMKAENATPISSDLVTENLDADLTFTGALKAAMALGGKIEIRKANINIPKSLPASVANLPIYRAGQKPPPPPPPPPDIALNLLVHAHNEIFIRGDGLFAEFGGRLTIGGTAADPTPGGGFTLIRGNFALGGKTLQFTKGVVSFNGAGFMPTLDLEATTYTTNNATATLIIGGTAAKPTITLTSSPPLPSDEILSQLLFGQSTQNLSPFQAASLAAALASLSGIGGSAVSDPLGGVRNALGLDELSLGGGQSGGAPSLQAGRYVAPGVYVGAQQSTSGTGTQATVQIDLYKGLKLQTQTGTTSSGSGQSSSVGLTYQFNY